MGIGSIMDKLRGVKDSLDSSEELTREVEDKQLISLQRQRQIQLNKVEKERLRKVVSIHAKSEFRKNMGMSKPKDKILFGRFNKNNGLLNDKNPLMKPIKTNKNNNILNSNINIMKNNKRLIK